MMKANVTIMLMYNYVHVCLFLSTYEVGYAIIGHATKKSKSKKETLQWNKITNY